MSSSRSYVDLDDIRKCTVVASGEEIGRLHDIMIEDRHWTTQYLVVECKDRMPGRRILIPIYMLERADCASGRLSLSCSFDDIEKSLMRAQSLSPVLFVSTEARMQSGSEPLWVATVPSGDRARAVLPGDVLRKTDLPRLPGRRRGNSDRDIENYVVHSVREVLGNEIRSHGLRLGTVESIGLNAKTMDVSLALVRLFNQDHEQLLPLPLDAFSAIGWNDKRMSLNLPVSSLAAIPRITRPDDVDARVERIIKHLLAGPNRSAGQEISDGGPH